jgi:GT2 family glycosyltransferase
MTNDQFTNLLATNVPTVEIIVLNWNGREDTLACLDSLMRLEYPSFQVTVVDNGSTDGSPDAVRRAFPQVDVLETGANLGYAGGNNRGLERALARGAPYILLLNNDTTVVPDMLTHLVSALEAEPTVGVAGPTIYYADRPEVIWTAGGAIDWRRGDTRMIGLDEPDGGQFGTVPREVDFVSGCAMLLRREVPERVGLLDERFFLYYEEVEWCVRARRAGFRIIHVPQARVWHRIRPQAQAESPTVHYYMTRNRLLFLALTGAGWGAWLSTVAANIRTLLSWSLRPRWRHKGPQRRAMVRALADACRGRWGFIPSPASSPPSAGGGRCESSA